MDEVILRDSILFTDHFIHTLPVRAVLVFFRQPPVLDLIDCTDMKSRIILIALLALLPIGISAQILKPVSWNFSAKAAPDSLNNQGEKTYMIHLTATIDPGWHVYAQQAGEGPIPTTISFEDNDHLNLIGEVEEKGDKISEFDKVFNSELNFFEKRVDFIQKVVVKRSTVLKGTVAFMVCDDKQCLPPKDVPFSLELKDAEERPVAAATTAVGSSNGRDVQSGNKPEAEIQAADDTDDATGKSLSWIFWAAFGGGFIALLTPCVFSVIPVTVSFFTKRSETRAAGIRNAIWYSLSIVIIYTLLGFLITLLFGPSALNQLASNIWANLAFFIIFLLFGLSFLGAFEISLPSSWGTIADSKAGASSFIGIFFMALTLAIVSFSCTGPIIGNLLVLAAQGGKAGPLVGMLGFSIALAIPFALFAIFPSWLNRMGKAGGWLNAVKVVLGLLELALALKFLSNVDMAYHWGILSREVFLCIWIVLFALIGFYLLGKLRFPHDSEVKHISITRLILAIAAFAFTVYLIPGLFGVQLKGIVGGFLPAYSSFNYTTGVAGGSSSGATVAYDGIRPQKYVDIFAKATPENYTAFYDYDEAMAAAKKLDRPLMIDFTGWSCVNCRKMESAVWTDPEVVKIINRDFVLLQLYVDDKTKLPKDQQYISSFDQSKIKTIGQKNADFEIVHFNRNSQPYYVFLNHQGKSLTSKGYRFDPDPQHFIDFLLAANDRYRQGETKQLAMK